MCDDLQREDVLVSIAGLKKRFCSSGACVHAVNGIDLKLYRKETLGLVGESGCGKSTLGLLMLRLLKPDEGKIHFDGTDITGLSRSGLKPLRKEMQIVFQNPYSSLNPRMKVGDILEEPLLVNGTGNSIERKDWVHELLSMVDLGSEAYDKYPHEFSGGQRQRIGIARAIALKPKLIVADEPVSALDVSVRGGILNLFVKLQEKLSLTYLFISHDLRVVEYISDRIAVMYLGKKVEEFAAKNLEFAKHPYTQALLSAIPTPDPRHKMQRLIPKGDIPSPLNPPSGCYFSPRCHFAKTICREEEPKLRNLEADHLVACHFAEKMAVSPPKD